VNEFLVRDLKAATMDEVMVNDLKYFDGSIGSIDRIPDDSKPSMPPPSEIHSVG